MAEIRISNSATSFVLYFETPTHGINAYAFATTLVALSDAVKAAGRTLNSAIEFEIVVEALGSGSFRARISAIARESGLFVKQQVLTGIVIGVLSSFIYDHTLSKKDHVEVQVNTTEVIISHGDDRIVVSREVHEASKLCAQNPSFVRAIDRVLEGATTDENVTGLGIATSLDGPPPALVLPRELLAVRSPLEAEPKTRIIEEDSDLYIVKAIMERSNRKWGFRWHGINISASIKDPKFYDDFAKHNFTIAPGDEFQARLAIRQVRDDVSGVYLNTGYEVIEVYRHVPHPKPVNLPLTEETGVKNSRRIKQAKANIQIQQLQQ
jgi:hypothetical protein